MSLSLGLIYFSLKVHQQLQELPEQWNNTKKISITVKQQVAPLQANEVANIRKTSARFDVRQHEFREEFRKIGPFWYNCQDPYEQLDKYNEKISGKITSLLFDQYQKTRLTHTSMIRCSSLCW